ncbi:MAG: GYD domain-containing protein [Nitrospirota bacterium]
MAYFIVLSSLTDKGRKTIKENPERILEVDKELEKMGVKVKEQYAILGPYDFVNIIEAPDNEAVMKMSVELGSRGSVQLLTLAAIPVSDFIKKLKKK